MVGLLLVGALAGAPAASAESQLFGPTGSEQEFVVPAGVTSVQVTATGQAGGAVGASAGGRPAVVSGTLGVVPGSTLYVEVGATGFNGGAASRGGGASDVRAQPGSNPTTLSSRRLIAGGGGGAATNFAGGDAGANGAGLVVSNLNCGGRGATAQGPGAGGSGIASSSGSPGAATGSTGGAAAGDAGGGGGGLFGGGGGGTAFNLMTTFPCGGGGGGSSLVPAGGTSSFAPLGTQGSVQITFTRSSGLSGSGAGAVKDTRKPSLASLSFSPKAFQAARSGSAITAKVGGKLSYQLSEAATTTFKVERAAKGRKKGRHCVRPTRRNRTKKRCARYVKVRGSFKHLGKAGANAFTFRGRVGGRKLKPGRYRLSGAATDTAGNKSPTVRTTFRIKP
jgi:hypothetical protein